MRQIDGDGPNPNIYHLIWKTDQSQTDKLEINIPETIIFLNGIPTNWYFTGQEGKILKKKIKNLNFETIVAKFSSGHSQDDIVAYFIHIDSSRLQQRLFLRQNIKEEEQASFDSEHSLIEYYTASEFTQEFSKLSYKRSGILQKFIYSRVHNDIIQAVWTPNLSVFTKKVNSNKLNNKSLKPHEKASTFDGPEFCTSSVPVKGKHLPVKLRGACEAISQHISHISYGQIIIEKLVAYFKADENEKIYFLWASSVRVKKKAELKQRSNSCKERPISLEPKIQSVEIESKGKGQGQRASSWMGRNQRFCVACNAVSNNLVPIMYKILIKYQSTEQNNHDTSSISLISSQVSEDISYATKSRESSSRTKIPIFLRKMYPTLRWRDYLALSQQESFLIQKAQVCEDCFLEATKNYEIKLKSELDVPRKISRMPQKPSCINRSENSQTSLRRRQYQSSSNSRVPSQRPSNKSNDTILRPLFPKISSDSQPSENLEKAQNVAESLRSKLFKLLMKKKENSIFSAKTAACSVSLNQNSSSTRLKYSSNNDQWSLLRERRSQNSLNMSIAENKGEYDSQNRSPVSKRTIPHSRNKLKSLNSSRMCIPHNRIKDIDDLLNESNENGLITEQKTHDDQSEATTNYQSSVRERYSRNGSSLLETRDIVAQKPLEIRCLHAKQAQIEAENDSKLLNCENLAQDQQPFVRNFFLKPGFQRRPSENLALNGNLFQDLYASIIRRGSEANESKRSYGSTKRERPSEILVDQENLQKSVVIEKLYQNRINTAHRAKFKKAI